MADTSRSFLLALSLLLHAPVRAQEPASADSAAASARTDSSAAAPADSGSRRVVREFPTVEVRSLLHDLRSNQTVHIITGTELRALPADGLADVVALQPGVVMHAEELHVRGGRAGETLVHLDGLVLNEPLRRRAMEVPLFALRSVELVSGAPEARYAGATAGVIDLHTIDPGERPAGEWRWQTDGATDTRYDRVGARVGTPIGVWGLGAVAAGEAMLDDTWLPALRRHGRHRVAGGSFGWRADNRMLGFFKLAPVAQPQWFSLQVLASRRVHFPYDPQWSLDGWVGFDPLTSLPIFSPTEQPGFVRYRAADHHASTDDRMLGTLASISSVRGSRRATIGLGWLRTRTVLSAIGDRDPGTIQQPLYRGDAAGDPYHVVFGEFPLYRRSASDAYALRADVETATRRGALLRFGAGATWEDVSLWELDGMVVTLRQFDALRSYHAFAPGAFAYGQGRWQSGEMVINAGLRGEYWTPGPQAEHQTFGHAMRGRGLFSPRLGLAFPISSRDVVSFAYTRLNQAPARDFLYDQRRSITNRQPIGDPGILPAVMISYEAAVKHLFTPMWALQTSAFYRDAARLPGAREYQVQGGRANLRYTDSDQASSAGIELSLVHAPDEVRRLEVHYAFMQAWGFESRPEGDPYGPTREPRSTPISETPLSWDRRHAVSFSGTLHWKRWSWGWATAVGAPLPWTPKPFRQPVTDLSTVNSRRFQWTESTSFNVQYAPPYALGLMLGLDVRNLFNSRHERFVTVDGYPNPSINTTYDDYGAYRTQTGLPGGAYWTTGGGPPRWVPVHDGRLLSPPRTIRVSLGSRW